MDTEQVAIKYKDFLEQVAHLFPDMLEEVTERLEEIEYMNLDILIQTDNPEGNQEQLKFLDLCEQYEISTGILLEFNSNDFPQNFKDYLNQLTAKIHMGLHIKSLVMIKDVDHTISDNFWTVCFEQLNDLMSVVYHSDIITEWTYNGIPPVILEQLIDWLSGSRLTKLEIYNGSLPAEKIFRILGLLYTTPIEELSLDIDRDRNLQLNEDRYLGQKIGRLIQVHPTCRRISLADFDITSEFMTGLQNSLIKYAVVGVAADKKVKFSLQNISFPDVDKFFQLLETSRNIKTVSLFQHDIPTDYFNEKVLESLLDSNLQTLRSNNDVYKRLNGKFQKLN